MTTAHIPYWRALRFYSKPWRERHGADMVAMMLDASDNGEDPLSGHGRRSLMWSGLRQRFASGPYVWFWIAVTSISLGLHQWASHRNIQIRQQAERFGDRDVDMAAYAMVLGSAILFVLCLTILTVSLLHRPAFPRPVDGFVARSWPGWTLFALGTLSWLGVPMILGSLVVGVRRYRAGGGMEFRLLAIFSAFVLGFQVTVLLPVVNMLFFI
ncbi:hypothetical protein Rhe02_01230 [Rhizocola hellebori]|uniref:Uncharacterized protein n=1 Tax=Rhizocola hellebori TaxID=1392758 RepID=A0A8J3Q1T7_9ACTN|nr:hypothetical protein [Rhizocola hellebori]GIH02056.1 hypothetical protein Rhe02_01230 [Rhizocola hellebori]